eukprot:gene9049-16172_t
MSKAGSVQVTAFQSAPARTSAAVSDISPMELVGLDSPTKAAVLESVAAAAAASPPGGSSNLAGVEVPLLVVTSSSPVDKSSLLDCGGSNLVRVEVPLQIVPSSSPVERSNLLDCVVVQRILMMEEKQAYKRACEAVEIGPYMGVAGARFVLTS